MSTAVPDVVADHRETVAIAATVLDFIRLVAEAAVDDDARRMHGGGEKARTSSWEAIAKGMRGNLFDASIELGGPGRRASRMLADRRGVEMR